MVNLQRPNTQSSQSLDDAKNKLSAACEIVDYLEGRHNQLHKEALKAYKKYSRAALEQHVLQELLFIQSHIKSHTDQQIPARDCRDFLEQLNDSLELICDEMDGLALHGLTLGRICAVKTAAENLVEVLQEVKATIDAQETTVDMFDKAGE
jgi:hypothetical protein